MEDIILYPGVELEVLHAAMERSESKETKKTSRIDEAEIRVVYSTKYLHGKKEGEVVIKDHEVIDLDSESDSGEDFHAMVESSKYQETNIQTEKIETNRTDSPISSKVQETLRSKQSLRDEERLPSPCRLCAIPCTDMIYIFGPTIVHKNILEKIQHCLPITVKETDPLSKEVCRSCVQKLESCYHFHKTVTEAEKHLLVFHEQTSGGLKKHTKVQGETSSQSRGQCIAIQNDNNEVTLKGYFDKHVNRFSCLDEDRGTRNSRCRNQNAVPPKESLNSGRTFASKSEEVICSSAQNSPIHEAVHLGDESESDQDVFNSVKRSPSSTTRQSVSQVESNLSPTMKSFNSMRKTSLKNERDTDTPLSCDEGIQGYARCGRNFSSQTIKCYLCGDVLLTIRKCRIHAKIHASTNYYPCCLCDKVMTAEKDWKDHWSQHIADADDKKSQRTSLCCIDDKSGKKSSTDVGLQYPELDHEPKEDSLYKRIKSDKDSDSEASLQQETEVVNNKLETFCGNTSDTESGSDIKDQKARRNARTFKCSRCECLFFTENLLKDHRKICLNSNNRFTCKYCERRFKLKAHLVRHVRTHVKIGSQNGGVRPKNYLHSYDSQAHRRVHTSKLSFKCTLCERTYASSRALRQHTYNRHTERERYPCSMCKKHFSSIYLRDFHEASHTKGKMNKCNLCEAKFTYPSGLYTHKRTKHKPNNPVPKPNVHSAK